MPYVLMVFAAVLRILPHPFNVTPVGAVGLFAGAYCRPRIAWAVPLVALLVGDLVGGFYSPVVMLTVYVGMVGGPLAGAALLRRRRSAPRFVGAVAGSSVFFYLSSNFGVWLAGMYPPSWGGLIECYAMGLPYLGRSLVGNLVYAWVLFAAFEWLSRAVASGRFALPGSKRMERPG